MRFSAFSVEGVVGRTVLDRKRTPSAKGVFTYWRRHSAAKRWLALLEAGGDSALRGADIVYFSGISLAILDPDERPAAIELLQRLRTRVGRIAFDPNVRLRLWQSPHAAAQCMRAALSACDIALPSAEDLASLFQVDEPMRQVELLMGMGVSEAAVTVGADGCVIAHGDVRTQLPGPRVERVVDTSGAGDAFNGAYLASRLQGNPPEDAAKAALLVASRVVTHAATSSRRRYRIQISCRRCIVQSILRLAGLLILINCAASAHAEDGYDLWLRYRPVETPWVERYRAASTLLVAPRVPIDAALSELRPRAPGTARGQPGGCSACHGARWCHRIGHPRLVEHDRRSASRFERFGPGRLHHSKHDDRRASRDRHRRELRSGARSTRVFHFLRLLQTRQPVDHLSIRGSPHLQLRILNHWDNLDGTVERGYAGASLWNWHKLPDYLAPRYVDYARACASIGINGTVITNVNADALSLTGAYLGKGGGASRRVSPLWDQALFNGAFHGADRNRRTEDGRSTGSGGAALVAPKGGRDISLHS